jgi:hypothetical protein
MLIAFYRSGEDVFPQFLEDFRKKNPRKYIPTQNRKLKIYLLSERSDQTTSVPGSKLDRSFKRLSASL